MDLTATRLDADTIARPTTKPSGRREGAKRETSRAKSADRARALRVEFEALAAGLREELAPAGVLDSIYVERAIVAAWRLREAAEADRSALLLGLGADSIGLLDRHADDLRRVADRADRSLLRALDALAEVRGGHESRWGRAARLDTRVVLLDEATSPDDLPIDPMPVAEFSPPDAEIADPAADAAAEDLPPTRWQDRLVFDFNISGDSPVVRGTWVTVAQVVTLIVDGQTRADLLRSHPELTEEDIRVCLAYEADLG